MLILFVAAGAMAQGPVPLQPLAQHVRNIEDALGFLGQPLPGEIHRQINRAMAMENEEQAVAAIQKALEPLVLLTVDINAESRVKVAQSEAKPDLVEGGTRLFLVKVENQAGVRARLRVESPNSGPTYLTSRGEAEPKMELTQQEVKERWADIGIYDRQPMAERLSGLAVEYAILTVYSRDRGQRSAKISLQRRAGHAGHRVPQRRDGGVPD